MRKILQITDLGQKVLSDNPQQINVGFLKQFQSFKEFTDPRKNGTTKAQQIEEITEEDQTPEEMLEYAHQKLTNDLSQELIETIKECSPGFFEKLVENKPIEEDLDDFRDSYEANHPIKKENFEIE